MLSSLGKGSKVSIKGNVLMVTMTNAFDPNTNRLVILRGTLVDYFWNQNEEWSL